MISVQRVYEAVREICNKDQKGFVTPLVFDTLARVAQQNIFNEMFSELKVATALRMSGRDAGRDKSAYKMVEEDLSTYVKQVNVAINEDPDFYQLEVTDNQGVVTQEIIEPEDGISFTKPIDLSRIISMHVTGTNTSIELIYDAEKAQRVLRSNLSTPTVDFPAALVVGNYVQVFPEDVEDVTVTYYRQPRSRVIATREVDAESHPTYSTLTVDEATGFTIFNQFDSRDFDLPEHYFNELVSEIVKMIGVRLRDTTLTSYGLQQTQAE
jgi:hypothetical protein